MAVFGDGGISLSVKDSSVNCRIISFARGAYLGGACACTCAKAELSSEILFITDLGGGAAARRGTGTDGFVAV